jgi:hypothetical protein
VTAEERERSNALAVPVSSRPGTLADDVRLQELWLSLQKRPWRSLAVMGASKGVDSLAAANRLAKIAWWYTGTPTCVFDMRDLSLRLLEHQLRDMAAQLQGGERIFIALRSTNENPTAAPLAQAADAAVLCIELGKTDMRTARRTLDAVGRDRFIGTLLVPREARTSKDLTNVDPPTGFGGL